MEKLMEQTFKSDLQEQLKQNDCVDERNLLSEIQRTKHRQFIQEKERQRIRETNHELKELELKLRSAYVAKALAAQRAEKEVLEQQERCKCIEENKILEAARRAYEEDLKLRKDEEFSRKLKFRQDLQDQMEIACLRRLKKYEEFLKEKKILDEIINKITAERIEEMKEKLLKQEQYREDIDKFLYAQKIWNERQKKTQEEEDLRLRKYAEDKENKFLEEQKVLFADRKEKSEISMKLGETLKQIEKEKQKREDLLIDLNIEELRAKEDEKYREELEKQLRKRILTRIQLNEQRQDIEMRKQIEQKEDNLFREEQLRLFAEQDRLELLSDNKRRLKVIEHRRAVQKLIEERKQRRAEAMVTLLQEREKEIQNEKLQQQLIEEERIKILKEHATALIGFIPPGILRESDREYLALPPNS